MCNVRVVALQDGIGLRLRKLWTSHKKTPYPVQLTISQTDTTGTTTTAARAIRAQTMTLRAGGWSTGGLLTRDAQVYTGTSDVINWCAKNM